ncbi:MAG: DUF2461 domain-containing protein [Oscillospiraceae bacterium]|jgi:uncharacterized protein (TIGR02453 family)|nr:DUF2461 domain-containing protein [Oscillospiraceae bacterium]
MFTRDTLDFLFNVRINDSKEWFESHREEYERYLLEPFRQLVEAVGEPLLALDSEFVIQPKITRTISRIYRDTRFSADKSKYRDSMWLTIQRDKKLYPQYPGFFFEINPRMAWWGCGMYLYDSATAESFRGMVLRRDPLFVEMERAFDSQSTFVLDDSDVYKRSKYPGEPPELRRWLDRRSLYLAHTRENPEDAFGEGLAERLNEEFKLLYPLYSCLTEVCARRITPERVRTRGV